MREIPNGLVLFLLLTSCSALKKTSHLAVQQYAEKTTLSQTQQLNAKKLTLTSDSSNTETEIELYPKGIFSYSVKDGFKGEATRLNIRRKEKFKQQTYKAEQLQRQTALKKIAAKSVKTSDQTKTKQRFVFNWLPWSIGFTCLALGLYWLKRKKLFLK